MARFQSTLHTVFGKLRTIPDERSSARLSCGKLRNITVCGRAQDIDIRNKRLAAQKRLFRKLRVRPAVGHDSVHADADQQVSPALSDSHERFRDWPEALKASWPTLIWNIDARMRMLTAGTIILHSATAKMPVGPRLSQDLSTKLATPRPPMGPSRNFSATLRYCIPWRDLKAG